MSQNTLRTIKKSNNKNRTKKQNVTSFEENIYNKLKEAEEEIKITKKRYSSQEVQNYLKSIIENV